MSAFLAGTLIFIVFLMVLPLYRLVTGPTLPDRMLGVGAVGSKTLVLLVLVGFLHGRVELFIDIAIAYSLLNFLGTLAIAKFLERKGTEP